MSRTLASIVLFAAAATLSTVSFAKDDARIAALRSAEMSRFEAQVNADAKALDRLLDQDLEYVHSNGDLDTKSSFIASLVEKTRDYVSMTPTIETLRIFGDVGVISGKARVTVSSKGNSQDLHIGYTDVWLWKDGRWQLTAWRSSRLPEPAAK